MTSKEELRAKIKELIEKEMKSEKWNDRKKKKLIQDEMASILGYDQSAISNALKGFHIDWTTGTIIEDEEEPDELWLMLKKSYITRLSAFFLSVPKASLKKVKEKLLEYFPSTDSSLGIVKIEISDEPRGLVIWADDNNLEHYLLNQDYLKSIVSKNDKAPAESSDANSNNS